MLVQFLPPLLDRRTVPNALPLGGDLAPFLVGADPWVRVKDDARLTPVDHGRHAFWLDENRVKRQLAKRSASFGAADLRCCDMIGDGNGEGYDNPSGMLSSSA